MACARNASQEFEKARVANGDMPNRGNGIFYLQFVGPLAIVKRELRRVRFRP
jgi:hypothetical protein